jgi:hypothetical protein
MIELKPLFKLGQVVATPGALEALAKAGQQPWELLAQHVRGQWGDLDDEDRRLNDEAVKDGSRLLSAYTLKTGQKAWVITEAGGYHHPAARRVLTFRWPTFRRGIALQGAAGEPGELVRARRPNSDVEEV